ncbi:hypothetical protein KM043_013472 [Ampulex compressa]|nr:hypothetical protein KM043_013472 [Ampulex compressa]
MSYVEHGPRIFLAAKANSGMSLTYGDYVMPRKRSEGRLKVYDSCSDIRAWSLNPLENSQYFRELTEHATPPGKIVPFNVVIDNIIGHTSQVQDELHYVKKELEQYKSLKLTPEQQKQLWNFGNATASDRQEMQGVQVDHVIRLVSKDHNKKLRTCVEYIDAFSQVEKMQFMHEIGVQVEMSLEIRLSNEGVTVNKEIESESPLTYKINVQNKPDMRNDEKSSQTSNYTKKNSEYDSCSRDSEDTESGSESSSETETDFESREATHKAIIIEKDSEIIALKNDLGVLQERLRSMEQQRNYEVDELKKKLYAVKSRVEQLKEDLNNSRQTCYSQSQEIEKLQTQVKEVMSLRTERDSLAKKIKEMEHLAKEAESCSMALEQLRNTVREKDELEKQNREQSCIMANQEDEIDRLLTLIKQTSHSYNDHQVKMKEAMEELRTNLHDRDVRISEYQDQYRRIKIEIGDFVNELKSSLKVLDESDYAHGAVCNNAKHSESIGQEAKNVLCAIKFLTRRLQGYKTEREELLQRIASFEYSIREYQEGAFSSSSQNVSTSVSDQEFHSEQDFSERRAIETNVPRITRSTDALSNSERHSSGTDIQNETVSNYFSSENLLPPNALDNSARDNKLRMYYEIERPYLIKYIYDFYEALKDVEEAIMGSDGITTKKRRVSELCDQYKKECEKYHSDISSVSNDFHGIQAQVNESLETILRRQLEELSRLEEKLSYDERIDEALAIQFTRSIRRIDGISAALQGAGDQHTEVMERVTKQQEEIEEKDNEIARLKEQVARHVTQGGEGDCADQEEKYRVSSIEEQLSKANVDLGDRDDIILKLREENRRIEDELAARLTDYGALAARNQDLCDVNAKLRQECQTYRSELEQRDQEIRDLSAQMQDLINAKSVLNAVERKMRDMEAKIVELEDEKYVLKNEVLEARVIVSKKDEDMVDLRRKNKRQEDVFLCKVVEHKALMEQKHNDILKLKNENDSLKAKLTDLESKLLQMNETILTLTEEADKIKIIYALQEDISKFDKDEKKLKVELKGLKAQLRNHRDKNKEVEIRLDTFTCENERLKQGIEKWRKENAQLSVRLNEKDEGVKIRDTLYSLSHKICDKIFSLKEEMSVQSQFSIDISDQFMNNRQHELNGDEGRQEYIIAELKKANEDLNTELKYQDSTIKQLQEKIKKVEQEKLSVITIKDVHNAYSKTDSTASELSNVSANDMINMKYTLMHSEKNNKDNQTELQKLMQDIESKNFEIKNLKESINRLTREKDEFQIKIKYQQEEYQDKLTLMKKNYDSSIKALCKRHNESVERLQMRFEDSMNSEKGIFDPESWLRSLSAKELAMLHEMICASNSYGCNAIKNRHEKPYFAQNDIEKPAPCEKADKFANEFGILLKGVRRKGEKNASKVQQNIKLQERLSTPAQRNLELQNYWRFIENSNKLSKDEIGNDHNNEVNLMNVNTNMQYLASEIDAYNSNYKQDFGFSENMQQAVQSKAEYEISEPAVKPDKDNTSDWQRRNFIYQCSIRHKLGNVC